VSTALTAFMSQVARRVDSYIFEKVRGEPRELYEASLHLIKSGGKRVRSALLFAAGSAYKEDGDLLTPFAASVELIHTFTLIHDDIMDRDDFRRGVRTVHSVWGEPMAITAGDLLFAKAFEIVTDSEVRRRTDPQRLAWAVNELARATATVAEGQALDLSFERRDWVTLEEYFEMVYKKTGALLESSAKIGAIVSGAPEKDVELLGDFAKKIGVAFQIRDDYLGIYGKEEVTGKPVFNDVKRGKKTFFVSLAYKEGTAELRGLMSKLLGNPNAPREELELLAVKLEEEGIKRKAEEAMSSLLEEALSRLRGLEGASNRQYVSILEELAHFIVKREK